MPQLADWTTIVWLTIFIAFLTETIVEFIKEQLGFFLNNQMIQLVGMIIGVLLATMLKASLFDTNEPAYLFVGYLFVGLVASRGSNYAHNWFDKLPRSK